jgi:hypothetical protein
MDPGGRIKVNAPQVVGEVIDGEAVIVNLTSGAYYSLAGAGGVVWSCIERRASVSEVVRAVKARFTGDGAAIEADVLRLIAELQDQGLVVPAAAGGEAMAAVAPDEPGAGPTPYEPPSLRRYDDMQDLLLLDPIHDVDEMGWPNVKPTPGPSS